MDKALRPALMLVGKDADVIPIRGPKNIKMENMNIIFQ